MKKERLHLVPAVLIDIHEKLKECKREEHKVNFRLRLEAIRDYCQWVLDEEKTTANAKEPVRQARKKH